jgi:hypothetical protein
VGEGGRSTTVGRHRAIGIQPAETIYQTAAGIIRANLTSPGRKEVSARMSSFEAPFFDGATAGFDVNRTAFFSYYTKGAGVALYLDLFIRGHTDNRKSLDDAFRLLRDRTWGAANASYYSQGRGYTEEDVVRGDAPAADMHAVRSPRRCDRRHELRRSVGAGGHAAGSRRTGSGEHGRRGGAGGWRIEPIANASAAQMKIRAGWISGKVNP